MDDVLPRLDVVDWGGLDYRTAWQRQRDAVDLRKTGDGVDTVFLVEHPHVITLGRRREARANVLSAGDVEVVEIERGGDATYHGPGQLVAYPIVFLREGERDLHRYLRNLEAALIVTCEHFGVAAVRSEGKTGAWTPAGKKLASIGIACRRWVTYHGVALNVSTDLSYFGRINPCGFEASVMTSLEQELGVPVTMSEVKRVFVRALAANLERHMTREPGIANQE